jgi:hypothetical protein
MRCLSCGFVCAWAGLEIRLTLIYHLYLLFFKASLKGTFIQYICLFSFLDDVCVAYAAHTCAVWFERLVGYGLCDAFQTGKQSVLEQVNSIEFLKKQL